MIEKRFVTDGLWIQDTKPKGRKYLLDEQGGVNALCNLINGMSTKSERLEMENEQLRHDASVLIYSNQDYRKENEKLKKELEKYTTPNCRKCIYYACDEVDDYCTSEESVIGRWNSFPYKWNYEQGAKDCKEYEE